MYIQRRRQIELAKATNTTVLYTPAEIAPEVTEPVKSAEEPVVVQLKQAPVMAVKPTGEEVHVAEVVTPPPAMTEIAEQTPPKTLPKTASPLPPIGLFGLVALGGAFALRFVSRRVR